MKASKLRTAAILVGGIGTRLADRTGGLPKCLMTFNGKVFLKMQLEWLKARGVRQVSLCTGHKSEMIVAAVETMNLDNLEVHISHEDQPLGTGGALKQLAQKLNCSLDLLVLNGDTFFNFEVGSTELTYSREMFGNVVFVSKVGNAERFGAIECVNGEAVFFDEKVKGFKGYVNVGCYSLKTEQLCEFGSDKFSLEHHYMPWLSKQRRLGCVELPPNVFYDFGTNESFDNVGKAQVNWLKFDGS